MSTEPKVGDRIKDNDPRMSSHRVLTIIEMLPEHVMAEESEWPLRRAFRIARKRIHTDGKPRRSGFDLLRGGPPGEGDNQP